MLCGTAESLTEIVLFRAMQGVFGAALVPLSQATMLDIFPPAQRGQAMAIWVMGVVVGPIMGPTLGGYLTDFYNWRWVFYINLPFGILASATATSSSCGQAAVAAPAASSSGTVHRHALHPVRRRGIAAALLMLQALDGRDAGRGEGIREASPVAGQRDGRKPGRPPRIGAGARGGGSRVGGARGARTSAGAAPPARSP